MLHSLSAMLQNDQIYLAMASRYRYGHWCCSVCTSQTTVRNNFFDVTTILWLPSMGLALSRRCSTRSTVPSAAGTALFYVQPIVLLLSLRRFFFLLDDERWLNAVCLAGVPFLCLPSVGIIRFCRLSPSPLDRRRITNRATAAKPHAAPCNWVVTYHQRTPKMAMRGV